MPCTSFSQSLGRSPSSWFLLVLASPHRAPASPVWVQRKKVAPQFVETLSPFWGGVCGLARVIPARLCVSVCVSGLCCALYCICCCMCAHFFLWMGIDGRMGWGFLGDYYFLGVAGAYCCRCLGAAAHHPHTPNPGAFLFFFLGSLVAGGVIGT